MTVTDGAGEFRFFCPVPFPPVVPSVSFPT